MSADSPSLPAPPDALSSQRGWRRANETPSLSEVHRTVAVPRTAPAWRKFLAFAGPGYLVAVGYMDPGNWATDLAGGSHFAYRLLSVIMLSNLMAILLQALAARLGIATGRDLAQACRDHYKPPLVVFHWVLCEIAIAACDLAEVLGSAIALKLLFGIPLLVGLCLTALDVLIVLFLQQKGFRLVEALVITLIATIGTCFLIELIFSRPSLVSIAHGFVPSAEILRNREMLYVGIGILGATVMPHNLYLHSSIVQTRAFEHTPVGKREAIRWATLDSSLALMLALFVNAAILIMAAATFYGTGHRQVAEIQDSYKLLSPLLGTGVASTLFALALLCSGHNATLTGTLAGQIVMEGFLQIRIAPWLRRLITRMIAIVPAVIVVALYGEQQSGPLLVLSQVILSLQLSFAVVPLVQFTSERAKMGEFVNPPWLKWLAGSVATLIGLLNAWLLYQSVSPVILVVLLVGFLLFALLAQDAGGGPAPAGGIAASASVRVVQFLAGRWSRATASLGGVGAGGRQASRAGSSGAGGGLERCVAVTAAGTRCERAAQFLDEARRGQVCREHAPPGGPRRGKTSGMWERSDAGGGMVWGDRWADGWVYPRDDRFPRLFPKRQRPK